MKPATWRMNNKGSYLLFFVTVLLVQIFLLDNLSLSTYVAPLLYVVCLILLPIRTSQPLMLFAGLALGIVMDYAMGTVGLNVIATLPIAFFRRSLLRFVVESSDLDNEAGIPTHNRLVGYRFHLYVCAIVVVHSLLFFGFESLSLYNFGYAFLRFVCSCAITLALVYATALLFIPKLESKS